VSARKKGSNERGSALVETALVSIFLLSLIMVVFELGTVFSSYVAVVNAAKAAASYASMHANPEDAEHERYIDIARHELRAAGLDMEQVEVLPLETPEGTEPGKPVSVTVVYHLTTFTSTMSLPLFGRMGLPSSYALRWTATMPIR